MAIDLGYIPIDKTRTTTPVYSPDGSKSTITNKFTNMIGPVPSPPSGSTPSANVIDMVPTPIPGTLITNQSSDQCPDCGTNAGSPGGGSGNGTPASGSILPSGFLAGKYNFKFGGKSYAVSKKAVWGISAVTGIGLLIAIIR